MSKSIFEKTMQACLESKKPAARKSSNKRVNEAVKARKKYVKEEDEIDDENQEVMDDVVDDIVVVVDPEMSEDDVIEAAEDAQDIIDGTPEGEIPMTDEYVGDMSYTCPICGNTFFTADEMHDGDECPVCGDTPDGFVLVGAIESPEEAVGEDEGEELEDEIVDDEELEPDMDIAVDDDIVDYEESKKPASRKMSRPSLLIDESTFNPFMNKFIRENYKNAKSFVITAAKRCGKRLSLECKITFKSGKSKKVTLTNENFNMKSNVLAFYEDGTFKAESVGKAKVAPFVFKTVIEKNVIKCEGMKYSLITRSKNEGKKIHISGRLVRENKSSNFSEGKKSEVSSSSLTESSLRPFSRSDYDGFAGVSDLPDGGVPQIYDGEAFSVILSGDEMNENIYVVEIVSEDNEAGYSTKSSRRAWRLANTLASYADNEEATVDAMCNKFGLELRF